MSPDAPENAACPNVPDSAAAHLLVQRGLLNPELDAAALGAAFANEGWVQVEQALRPEVAEALFDCLDREVPWSLAFRDADGPRKLWSEELAGLGEKARERLDRDIVERARRAFQFRYDSFMMVTAYKEKRHTDLVLHRVLEAINRPEWLETMRTITGCPNIKRADAQATRYVAGHFLRRHNDENEEHDRLCAYVINLTRSWNGDWGGLLQFFDQDGDVIRTLMPRFNTISIFRVPADHCVSPVAPFATGARYAITGWLRS